MRQFLGDLFKGPDGDRTDEMATLAILVGMLGVFLLLALIGLEIYDVVGLGHRWMPNDFANAGATLFAAVCGGLAAIGGAMGLKAKLGG